VSIRSPAHVAAAMRDRVIIAAGEDKATGTSHVAELKDRITRGIEPPLTQKEWVSLAAWDRGKLFARKRGQHNQGKMARVLRPWLLDLKAQRRSDLRGEGTQA
jgi:hypothetical protein